MRCEYEIVLILDSILDDYYMLWECFEEFKQITEPEGKTKDIFSEALKIAYEHKYFNFFVGKNFNGEEALMPDFELTNSVIEELLDYKGNMAQEIRVTTSGLGIEFLKTFQNR